MNVYTAIDKALSAVMVLGAQWVINGNEVLCGDTPILVIPAAPAGDIGNTMRVELITNLVKNLEAIDVFTNNRAITGPWAADSTVLYFNAMPVAYISESKENRVPFQVAALEILVSGFNILTPRSALVDYTMKPVLSEDGYSTAISDATERSFAFDESGLPVQLNTAGVGDTVIRCVFSTLYGFVKITRCVIGQDHAAREFTITKQQLSDIQNLNPELFELMVFKDEGANKVLVADLNSISLLTV